MIQKGINSRFSQSKCLVFIRQKVSSSLARIYFANLRKYIIWWQPIGIKGMVLPLSLFQQINHAAYQKVIKGY